MTRTEFEVLAEKATASDRSLQKQLWGITEKQTGEALLSLEKDGLIQNGRITEQGLAALEPYRVRRAIFLAAGFGSRMMPITVNTPKPMVYVHGKRIIETIIDAVLAAGIEEIYIVRGYLGETFDLLLKKYPTIRFIENPDYACSGTISSFYCARHLLSNAYVMESDLVVQNPGVISKYHYTSDFLGTKVDETDDWFFRVQNGIIDEIGVNGSGNNCYKLIGISHWSREDGEKLAHDVREAYEGKDGKKLYMSYVPFRVYKDKYKVEIMPCRGDDIVEIDSFKELQAYDCAYEIK